MQNTNPIGGIRLVIGYMGVIIMLIGVIVMLPLLVLPAFPYEYTSAKYFIIPGVCTILIGYLLSFFVRGQEKGYLDKTQSAIIVVLSWLIAIIVCALPFYLTGEYNLTQAIFESTSGWSASGLTVVDVAKTSHIFLMHRSFTMFFGGVGLVLVMLSVLSDSYGMGLYRAEGHPDKLLPNLLRSSRVIMAIYSGYIVGGTVLYTIFGMTWFDAFNHSICAVATGGFSTKPESIGYYHSVPIETISIILMILGSTNFLAHLCLLKGQPRRFFKYCENRFTLAIYAFFIPIMAFFIFGQLSANWSDSFRIAAFQAVSALSTTGFQTVLSFSNWPSTLMLLMIILMLIGGQAGSTAGGIKQLRVYIILKSIIWSFRDSFSNGKIVRADSIQKPIEKEIVTSEIKSEMSIFIFVYILVFLLGTFLLCGYGYDLQHAMFEYSSAMGGVGLSSGITSYDANPVILWALSFGMFVGRLEIFVVFLALMRLVSSTKHAIFKR